MLGDFFYRMRLSAAARQYARHLPPQIQKDYGASESYTSQQIDKSAARARLPADYIAFGYALFLDEPAFKELHDGKVPGSYIELGTLLKRYALKRTAAGFEPAAENCFAISGAAEAYHTDS